MEGGLGGVEAIEIGNEVLDAAVGVVPKQMPIEAAGFAPFIALGEFLAHEEEFLPGMRVLIAVKQAEIREVLPGLAGHFVEQRVFSVDHFIMGKREEEILGEGIEE